MFKCLMAVALATSIGVPVVYLAVPSQPAPPPPGPHHPFTDTDGDGFCDYVYSLDECDQLHADSYNTPTHVKTQSGYKYLGEGRKASNNYH